MQAEMASSAGLNANHFCRTCKVGGTREFKQSDEGFETLFKVRMLKLCDSITSSSFLLSKAGEHRTCNETAETTVEQLLLALQPLVATALVDAVRKSGVKDAMAQPVIEKLVKLGQDLRKSTPEQAARSPDEVTAILVDELAKAHEQGGLLNPLINMDGMCSI